MTLIVADDRGFGNSKVCVGGRTAVLPSIVARPQTIGLAAIGLKTGQRPLAVSFQGQSFWVGEAAWRWGAPFSSLDYTSLVSPERMALFYAALAQLLPAAEAQEASLIMGLPVPLLQDEIQASHLLDALKQRMKGRHVFQVGEAAYELQVSSLRVLAQPVGAYMDWLLDEELRPRSAGQRAEVAVLDIGLNTVDLFVLQAGRALPRYLGGDKVGVRRLLGLISTNGHDAAELDSRLRRGRLKVPAEALDIWLGEILAVIERVWPSLRRFHAVIPAGGGAAVLGARLRLALSSKGAALYWPADPVGSNVQGLWKWGARQQARRRR